MLTALIGPVSNLLGKFIEDKDMKNKLAHEVATMAENHAQELAKGQIEINKADLKVDTFRSSGAGGQHVNNGDFLVHILSS